MRNVVVATISQKPITADEFALMPASADGSREELVKGEIIVMPPPGFRHGKCQLKTGFLLLAHVEPARLGQVVVETGVRTEHGPDSVRGPDISFWSVERLPLTEQPLIYPAMAPDLCVEILSPSDTWQNIREKLIEYFDCGVRMVWVVDPSTLR